MQQRQSPLRNVSSSSSRGMPIASGGTDRCETGVAEEAQVQKGRWIDPSRSERPAPLASYKSHRTRESNRWYGSGFGLRGGQVGQPAESSGQGRTPLWSREVHNKRNWRPSYALEIERKTRSPSGRDDNPNDHHVQGVLLPIGLTEQAPTPKQDDTTRGWEAPKQDNTTREWEAPKLNNTTREWEAPKLNNATREWEAPKQDNTTREWEEEQEILEEKPEQQNNTHPPVTLYHGVQRPLNATHHGNHDETTHDEAKPGPTVKHNTERSAWQSMSQSMRHHTQNPWHRHTNTNKQQQQQHQQHADCWTSGSSDGPPQPTPSPTLRAHGTEWMVKLHNNLAALDELCSFKTNEALILPSPSDSSGPCATSPTPCALGPPGPPELSDPERSSRREAREPSTRRHSYGIALWRTSRSPTTHELVLECTLVGRRVSIGYYELLAGNAYVLSDLPKIWLLLCDTTTTERDMLQHWSYQDQRDYVWGANPQTPVEWPPRSGDAPRSSDTPQSYEQGGAGGPGRFSTPPPSNARSREGTQSSTGVHQHSLARHKFEYLQRGFWWSFNEFESMGRQASRTYARGGSGQRSPVFQHESSERHVEGERDGDRSGETSEQGKIIQDFRHFASRRKLVTWARTTTPRRASYPSGNRVLPGDQAIFVTLTLLTAAANLRSGTDNTIRTTANSANWSSVATLPRYTFPKGRMSRGDTSPLACAVREFAEETNIPPSAYDVMCHVPPGPNLIAAHLSSSVTGERTNPAEFVVIPVSDVIDLEGMATGARIPVTLTESFVGLDQQTYTYVYFCAQARPGPMSCGYLTDVNVRQLGEIGHVGWFTFEQARAVLRPAGQRGNGNDLCNHVLDELAELVYMFLASNNSKGSPVLRS